MEWTVHIGETDYIARTDEELRQWYREGRVTPQTFVFHPVLTRWIRAGEMEELRHLPRVLPQQRQGGTSGKTTAIVIAVGVAIILVLLLISSIEKRSAQKEHAADVAGRERIRNASIAAAHTAISGTDPSTRPDEYARHCDTLRTLDAASLTPDLKARCAVANFENAKRSFRNGDLVGARGSLGAAVIFGIADDEYKRFDAQLTRRETVAREKEEAEEKAHAAKESIERKRAAIVAREAYGEMLRSRFLDQSLDIKVTVSGAKKDRITLKFVLFNDVWAHRMQKDGLLEELHAVGFRKVTLTDGYDYTVYWDFK